jgi:hypothetical protein
MVEIITIEMNGQDDWISYPKKSLSSIELSKMSFNTKYLALDMVEVWVLVSSTGKISCRRTRDLFVCFFLMV